MAPTVTVALAGATGNLGKPILQALLNENYNVVVLTRFGGSASTLAPHHSLSIKEVNFKSPEQLIIALAGVEVVISCLATLAIDNQNPLIDAAETAGVKRFIPAEFGIDCLNPLSQQLPVGAWKVSAQEYLMEKHKTNSTFSYTAIANGLFLDWGLKVGYIINPAERTAILYNGGNIPFSATSLGDIAQAVIGVIRNQAATANRVVYVHSTVTTQNQLIQYAMEKDGRAWTTTTKDTDEIKKESFAKFEKGDHESVKDAINGFCACACFNSDYGCDFSGHLDNDILGVKTLDESSLRSLVQKYLSD